MDIRTVDEGFAVAPQLQPEDMAALAEAGYRTVICNRPDGEDPGQPDVATMREAAQSAGMAFHHLPVSGGQFPQATLEAFADIRRAADAPVLAYCRTGTRSITIDSLANPFGLDADERLQRAERAGYDLSGLRDRLGD